MIVFGVAEVFTGLFLGHRIGVSTGNSTVFAVEGPTIGALYVIGGFLLLTGKKWAAGLWRFGVQNGIEPPLCYGLTIL
jgi:hypothetical protein